MTRTAATARKHDRSLLAFGALFVGGGFYFVLVSLGIAPSPGRINGPHWLALAVGLVFLAAGASVLVRGWLAVPDHQSHLPADAPVTAVVIQWLAVLVVIVGLASVGTWSAFGSGDRAFGTNLPLQGSHRETAGRIAFGIGAVITWLMAVAVAYAGVNRIFRRNTGPSS